MDEERNRRDHRVADVGVLAHLDPFFGGQLAGLEQHRVGHADLPDVVQQRAAADLVQLRALDRHDVRDGRGVLDHALAVIAGLVLARVERGHQGQQGVLVGGGDVLERAAQLGGAVAHLALELLLVALASQLDAPLGERALDGADEVGQLRRLEQVVDRAAAQAVDRRLGVAVAGEHDHRGVGVLLAERLEQPQPVLPRHLHVGDDQRRVFLLGELEGHVGARGDGAVVALFAEQHADHVADGLVVVDDQDSGGRRGDGFQGVGPVCNGERTLGRVSRYRKGLSSTEAFSRRTN